MREWKRETITIRRDCIEWARREIYPPGVGDLLRRKAKIEIRAILSVDEYGPYVDILVAGYAKPLPERKWSRSIPVRRRMDRLIAGEKK